jgi:hypothetical protein
MREHVRSALAVTVLLSIGSAACGSNSDGNAASSESPTTAVAQPTDQKILKAVSWQSGDLADGYEAVPYESGDEVENQVTLDLCGGDFPSEARRTARWQVGVDTKTEKPVSASIEAVLYDTPGGAEQALAEARAAQTNCPDEFVEAAVAETPPAKFTFAAAPDKRWPQTAGVDRFAVAARVEPQGEEAFPAIAVYQQRGRLLVGFYLANPTDAEQALTTDIEGLANNIADRMSKLPATAVA